MVCFHEFCSEGECTECFKAFLAICHLLLEGTGESENIFSAEVSFVFSKAKCFDVFDFVFNAGFKCFFYVMKCLRKVNFAPVHSEGLDVGCYVWVIICSYFYVFYEEVGADVGDFFLFASWACAESEDAGVVCCFLISFCNPTI